MESLPNPIPDDPLELARQWLDEAAASVPTNPWAMALATVAPDGRPSLRYVLLKDLAEAEGHVVFYTNYHSRKAAQLDATAKAAGTLYWPATGRQLRLEGRIERSPAAESDAYFASRPRASQLNAWASEQSQPIESPDAMAAKLEAREAEFASKLQIPRPPGWGGYRLVMESIEFWVAGDNRFHHRLQFLRQTESGWSASWLQP